MIGKITHNNPAGQSARRSLSIEKPLFKSGDIIHGTVIRKGPGKEILVSSRGIQFLAHTDLDLKEGSLHKFQVQNLGQRVDLKILDVFIDKLDSPLRLWVNNRVSRLDLSGILTRLSQTVELKNMSEDTIRLINNLNKLFPAIITNDNGTKWNDRLISFFQGSGLFWENKVMKYIIGEKDRSWNQLISSDLKGILLCLKKQIKLESGDIEQARKILHNINHALTLIEQDQLLNLSSMKEGLGWFWFLPGLLDDGFRQGELFVREKKVKDELYFSMLLEFTMLGKFEVLISIINSVINIDFYMEDSNQIELINMNLPRLEEALRETGMVTGQFTCNIKEGSDLIMNPFIDCESSQAVSIVI